MSKIVAEIGCNHKGDFSIASEMVCVAAELCEVDAIKFQKRDIPTLLSASQRNAPHPEPHQAYGSTYGEHRQALEFTLEQHQRLKEFCSAFGVIYSCSVWDVVSAREIASLEPAMIKVPSAQNLNWKLLQVLTQEFGGEIHVALGMTSRREEEKLVDFLIKSGRISDTVLYACTSAYPAEHRDVYLLEIERLRKTYGGEARAVGFSGHHLGIALDNVAVAFGAEWIERHFTLNRTWKGTDHAASLEPDDLRHLCRDIRHLKHALKTKPVGILDAERAQRDKLKMLMNE